jgi:hypothetical protein
VAALVVSDERHYGERKNRILEPGRN